MGNFWVPEKAFHLNSPHKDDLGILNQNHIRYIYESGTYQIAPHEIDSQQIQVLYIPKVDTNQYYALSYRQNFGIDSALPSSIVQGAQLHLVSPSHYDTETYILDLTPKSGYSIQDFDDAGFIDSLTYTDTANNITITQLAHNGQYTEIKVEMAPVDLPDLSINSVMRTDTSGTGDSYLDINVVNNGTAYSIDRPIYIFIYTDPTTFPSSLYTQSSDLIIINNNLRPGEEITVETPRTHPVQNGDDVFVWIDPYSYLIESDKDNNYRQITVGDQTASPTPGNTCPNFQYGDADCNSLIEMNDYDCWKSEFEEVGPPTSCGNKGVDFDNNGDVDLLDFTIWRTYSKYGIPR